MIQTQCKSQLFRKTNLHSNEHPERKSPKQERSRILNILFCALFAISGALCSGWSKQSAVDAYNKGLEFYKKGQAQKAAERFRKAAEQGYAPAQYNLGVCYAKGQGVAQNYAEAVKWYSKAAEQGNKYAQNNLGVCYKDGQGVAQNYAEAVKWFTKAAEQGNKYAQNNLGVCYARGQGVAQNYAEAVKWYTKAAEQGDAPAQTDLGLCYARGQGVARNYAEALKWYTKAANQGFVPSYAGLSACYYEMKAYSQAFKWARKAAEAGDAIGMYLLGVMYAQGTGVEADKQMAIQWLTKAANKGFKPAREILNKIE